MFCLFCKVVFKYNASVKIIYFFGKNYSIGKKEVDLVKIWRKNSKKEYWNFLGKYIFLWIILLISVKLFWLYILYLIENILILFLNNKCDYDMWLEWLFYDSVYYLNNRLDNYIMSISESCMFGEKIVWKLYFMCKQLHCM